MLVKKLSQTRPCECFRMELLSNKSKVNVLGLDSSQINTCNYVVKVPLLKYSCLLTLCSADACQQSRKQFTFIFFIMFLHTPNSCDPYFS